ncbi:LA2681 family HEPN domain-containing protein [Albibacterium bauzanense]|uniref:LA2681-like HEPN domain-containing protein n=1 Tax=Albibacterium bauzanense TaxID=653929 RepID=A0A4R1LPX6_9SPHI|nr:LA2681 family HEPN domain-containing protein [Albibacterium bauzanense]TCK80905.1 hypothetical protein C8N28_2660 [Albibacterium bauzanense]
MSKRSFDQLLELDPTNFNDVEILDFIGELFDLSLDLNNPKGIDKGLELSLKIADGNLSNSDLIRFHYYLANGWSSRRFFTRYEKSESWDFDQQELSKELFHLRKCISIEDFNKEKSELQCQVYTNLGNHFSHVGRFIDAQEWWNKALSVISYFPMALGNIGHGLFSYAGCLYSSSHKTIFVYHAYKHLKQTLNYKNFLHPNAYQSFKKLLENIERQWPKEYLDSKQSFEFDLGKNKKLRSYREWCLQNTLYLNSLNDLGPLEIASHDLLHLPSMTVELNATPKYHTLFNQIKQEYGTARFLFYEGTRLPSQSYGDKDIVLVDTSDYAEYSYNLEKIKITYRIIYSLFDKIAYLLNDYLKVGMPRNRTSFRGLWHENNRDRSLRNIFMGNRNLALRGLYWLSKDLFDKDDAHVEAIEPEAKELSEIRNHIEHKSFKIKQYGNWGEDEDNFTFSIGRAKFEQKTFKQLRLIRAAIIYTSLAIHHEEVGKEQKHTILMYLPDVPFKDRI